jgi:hypothetical protein
MDKSIPQLLGKGPSPAIAPDIMVRDIGSTWSSYHYRALFRS